jgi:hypothetical protein
MIWSARRSASRQITAHGGREDLHILRHNVHPTVQAVERELT